jgi:hypothetical protein
MLDRRLRRGAGQLRRSNLRVGLSIVGASSVLAVFVACATQGADTPAPDGGTLDDGGVVDAARADDADGGDADARPPCEGESDCKIYPGACTDQTLCAASVAINSSARLLGLWAANDHDLWAAGTMGTVLHSDGATWKAIPTGRLETLRSVSGTGPNDVWFASTDRFLMHTQGALADGGAAWDIYDSSAIDSPHLMQSIWGSAAQGMWGLIDNNYGPNGLILHSAGWQQDGGGPAWTLDLAPTYMDPPGPFGGRSLYGFGATDVWSGWVGGQLYRRDVDGGWKELNSGSQSTLNGIWGPTANDLFLVGSSGSVRHWDGQTITTLELEPSIRDYDLFGVCGTSSNDVWIVGDKGLVLHWDGQHFTRIAIGALQGRRPTLRGIRVSSTTDQIWVVGDAFVLGGKKGALQ